MKSSDKAFIQGYNTQAAVDADCAAWTRPARPGASSAPCAHYLLSGHNAGQLSQVVKERRLRAQLLGGAAKSWKNFSHLGVRLGVVQVEMPGVRFRPVPTLAGLLLAAIVLAALAVATLGVPLAAVAAGEPVAPTTVVASLGAGQPLRVAGLARALGGAEEPAGLGAQVEAGRPSVRLSWKERVTTLEATAAVLQQQIQSRESETARLRAEVEWLRSCLTVCRSDRGQQVAITIDDLMTDLTLVAIRTAKEKQASITLFPIGGSINTHPEWFQEAIAAGFEIGNHTSTHEMLNTLPLPRAAEAIAAWNDIARDKLGYQARFFRPPGQGGWADWRGEPALRDLVAKNGLIAVLWDVETVWALYSKTGPQHKGPSPGARDVAEFVVDRARPGSIILLHDNLDVYALPMIIDGLRAKGLEPVTLSTLLGAPGE